MEYQNSFRIERLCTMDSIAVLDQNISIAIIEKEAVTRVFLDIEKAHDSLLRRVC